MARGKHGQSAAVRQLVTEAETSVEVYQRQVKKLLDENKALKEKLAANQSAHSKEVRILKAERAEGVAPMVAVLQQENERLKAKTDRLDDRVRAIQTGWDNAASKVRHHFITVHGYSGHEAAEVLLQLIGAEDLYKIAEHQHQKKLEKTHPGAVVAIQRARGERK